MKFGLVKLVYTYVISLDCWLTRTHIVRAKFCERMDGFFAAGPPEGSSEHILQDWRSDGREKKKRSANSFPLPPPPPPENTAKMRGKRAAHDSPHQPNISPLFFPRPRTKKKEFLRLFYGVGNTGTVKRARKKTGTQYFCFWVPPFFLLFAISVASRSVVVVPPFFCVRYVFFAVPEFWWVGFFSSVSWQFGLG